MNRKRQKLDLIINLAQRRRPEERAENVQTTPRQRLVVSEIKDKRRSYGE